jgi:uncharacterized membrane protein
MLRTSVAPALASALLLAACGGGAQASTSGRPTGATDAACRANGWTGLTYTSFGQRFATSYCTTCHAVASADRRGAPPGVDFDTLAGIQEHAGQIDALAGENIAGTIRNSAMPPPGVTPFPDGTERQQLACWIAAGLPAQ